MPESKPKLSPPSFPEQWAGRQKLRHTAREPLINLALYADMRGRCDVSVQVLAKDTHLAVSTVKKIIREFEGLGLLRRHGCGIGRTRDLVTLNWRETMAIPSRSSVDSVEGP